PDGSAGVKHIVDGTAETDHRVLLKGFHGIRQRVKALNQAQQHACHLVEILIAATALDLLGDGQHLVPELCSVWLGMVSLGHDDCTCSPSSSWVTSTTCRRAVLPLGSPQSMVWLIFRPISAAPIGARTDTLAAATSASPG